MSLPGLSGTALVTWLDDTSAKWQNYFQSHARALELPCGVRETDSIRAFLQHIVAVELRYAQRLCDLPETSYAEVPDASSADIFAVHDRAMQLLQSLEDRNAAWWQAEVTFTTRSAGEMHSARQTIFAHLVLHSIRHYAQLATLVRQQGQPSGLTMDYLFVPGNAVKIAG